MENFAGHVAVVTGASSGIGKAIAQSLAAHQATLCLVGRNQEALEAVAASAREGSSQVFTLQADLLEDSDIHRMAARLKERTDRVDFLIHSAGTHSLGALESAPVQHFDWLFRTNVRAPYLLTQLVLPLLRRCQGQIVFINSLAGTKASARVSQYAATKHALKAVADSLRKEVNPERLRVLNIFVGRTATPMQESVHALEGRAYCPDTLMQPGDVAAMVVNALRLPLSSQVTEIHMEPLNRA